MGLLDALADCLPLFLLHPFIGWERGMTNELDKITYY